MAIAAYHCVILVSEREEGSGERKEVSDKGREGSEERERRQSLNIAS